jgi:hypothetical protein
VALWKILYYSLVVFYCKDHAGVRYTELFLKLHTKLVHQTALSKQITRSGAGSSGDGFEL